MRFRKTDMRLLKPALAMLLLTILGGCVLFGGPRDKALRRTPAFREGYSDGCAAANNPSANPREQLTELSDPDHLYRRGWASGFQTCRTTSVAPGDAITGPLPGVPH
jgi:hypothetical protein